MQGRRPVRRGSRGAAVKALQKSLVRLGYDPGPVDGLFGLLTEEAVYQLQADHHLRRDGVAGQEVARLLGAGLPSALRQTHTVSPGDDVYSLAERYGVSPALLSGRGGGGAQRTRRPERTLVPGAQVVIPVRPVLAVAEESDLEAPEGLRRALIRHRDQVTALVTPWLKIAPDGLAEGKVASGVWELAKELRLPLVARVMVATPDGLVPTGRRRREAAAEIARTAARYHLPGLHITFDALAPGERYTAAALVSALRLALLPSTLLHLEVPLTAPGSGDAPSAGAAAELQAAGDLAPADRLVVRLTSPPAGGDRSLVRQALRRHPCYRVHLGLSGAGSRADLAARLALVTGLTLSGVALWDLAAGQETVFRAMADLFSVQSSQAWVAGLRNIRQPGA